MVWTKQCTSRDQLHRVLCCVYLQGFISMLPISYTAKIFCLTLDVLQWLLYPTNMLLVPKEHRSQVSCALCSLPWFHLHNCCSFLWPLPPLGPVTHTLKISTLCTQSIKATLPASIRNKPCVNSNTWAFSLVPWQTREKEQAFSHSLRMMKYMAYTQIL